MISVLVVLIHSFFVPQSILLLDCFIVSCGGWYTGIWRDPTGIRMAAVGSVHDESFWKENCGVYRGTYNNGICSLLSNHDIAVGKQCQIATGCGTCYMDGLLQLQQERKIVPCHEKDDDDRLATMFPCGKSQHSKCGAILGMAGHLRFNGIAVPWPVYRIWLDRTRSRSQM